jgi:hypothetical protein
MATGEVLIERPGQQRPLASNWFEILFFFFRERDTTVALDRNVRH